MLDTLDDVPERADLRGVPDRDGETATEEDRPKEIAIRVNLFGFSRAAELDDLIERHLRYFWQLKG